MHKAKNMYFLIIKKKRDGPRQEVAQGRVPSPTAATALCGQFPQERRVVEALGHGLSILHALDLALDPKFWK